MFLVCHPRSLVTSNILALVIGISHVKHVTSYAFLVLLFEELCSLLGTSVYRDGHIREWVEMFNMSDKRFGKIRLMGKG